MESTLCGLFWRPHFTSHQVHLCGSISWIIFIYMARPHFIYAFMHWWTFGFFVLFSCWEFLLPFVYEFFGGPCIFTSCGYATRNRNVESYGSSRFNCWKTARLFLKPLCQFTFPPAVPKSFNFTTSSSTLVIICLLDCSHPRVWEVISPWGSDMCLPPCSHESPWWTHSRYFKAFSLSRKVEQYFPQLCFFNYHL